MDEQPKIAAGKAQVHPIVSTEITAFSPEAHLIFRSASLFLRRLDQFQLQELHNKMGTKKKRLSKPVENLNRQAYLQD